MKGVIVIALKELVVSNFGEAQWKAALSKAGIEKEPLVLPISDVEDALCMKVISGVCQVLNITLEQAAEAFGDYWMNAYAPKMYHAYFEEVRSAKDFLLKMDHVHVQMTRYIPNATPPRFEYEWKDDKTLIMKYVSKRGLMAFLVGLIKGVGKHFNEVLTVQQIGADKVCIGFQS